MTYLRKLMQLPRSTKALIVVGVIVVILLSLITVFRSNGGSTIPYDPTSFASDGTRGAVDTMRKLGSQVNISTQVGGDVIVVFDGRSSTQQNRDIGKWVKAGGTLIIATENSTFADVASDGSSQFHPRTLTAACTAPWAEGIERITPGGRNYSMISTKQADQSCFKDGNDAFVTTNRTELGTVVQVGSPTVFDNENLDKTDNAVLLDALTGASNGSSITILEPDLAAVEDSGQTLSSLIPGWMKHGFAQLILACIVFALWRARRLKALISEPQPVELPASALTLAVGELLESAKRTDSAARVLRGEARQRVAQLFSVDASIDARTLITLVADRTGIDERRLAAALLDGRVETSNDLLRLSQELELMQREVANVR